MRAQPESTAAVLHHVDYIRSFLVISEAVDDYCASIGKDSLYPKLAAHGVY
jgi:hypothetical protein